MPELRDLIETFPSAGRVEWIGIAAERLGTVVPQEAVTVQPGTGIEGEHHASGGTSHRQVTLIQQEHLPVVAALSGKDITPEMLRRNIMVSGINLLALKRGKFRIGDVLLEGTGPCAPCSRMEQNLGPGGYNAMRGHGGITAAVIEGGTIRIGDAVEAVNGYMPESD